MLPFFYQKELKLNSKSFQLDEATSKHCIQVLRMQNGEELLLTDGKGLKAKVSITDANRKHTIVEVQAIEQVKPPNFSFGLAIAFTKNNSRNEWLLEKATELGIADFYPIITQRGEKDKLKIDRLNNILIAAMLQSQQVFLPQLHEAIKIKDWLKLETKFQQKFIAHCEENQVRNSYINALHQDQNTIVLIGPEGDFTNDEIDWSLKSGFIPVSLGVNRLRTETAGIYACTIFNSKNYG